MSGLLGRQQEQEALARLLDTVRDGRGHSLVLRGEAGAGKTALLDDLVADATGCRVILAAGFESESEIAYSGLEQICVPLRPVMDRLPEAHRRTLGTALGLSTGPPPELLDLGAAALALIAEAAAEKPLLVVVDDVQWLDRITVLILAFVAHRLGAERVGLLFGARDPEGEDVLSGLPELRIGGLGDDDARRLLDEVVRWPLDEGVRARIVAETRGNPLALLELPRGLSPAELAFGFGGRSTPPCRVEDGFRRRVEALPERTRTVLLAAAVAPIGDAPLLWRALRQLGIDHADAGPGEHDDLIRLEPELRFRHSLIRTATLRAADPIALRAVHAAFAQVIDPITDPDRRAWHRAHAALGPDESVAAELADSAGRAFARGGRSAAAAFLERAAELTPDPGLRAGRALAAARSRLAAGLPGHVPDLLAAAALGPLDPLRDAEAARLRAQLSFVHNPGRDTVAPLLAAARPLVEPNPGLARETYLAALGAALHAGRLGGDELLRGAAEEARRVEAGGDATGLFLTGLTAWILEGYASSLPALQRALAADPEPDLLWIAAITALELWDEAALHRIVTHATRHARESGAMHLLAGALSYRAGSLTFDGRLAEAGQVLDEAAAIGRAAGVATYRTTGAIVLAHQGRERAALARIEAAESTAADRGLGRRLGVCGYAGAVLYNGLGKYSLALESARRCVAYPEYSVHGWGLSELVEAAVRAGDPATAADARERLAERTAPLDRPWARGAQAVADALAGPPDKIEINFRGAIAAYADGRLALPQARARLLYGEWLRRANRRAAARTELRAAHEAFTTMGAEAFADRAGRELQATGETLRRRSAGERDVLTAQESRIARLAVDGRGNTEIGAELFLSPRTVEWHLRKVFTKLDIGSRRDLAAALDERNR